MTDTQLYIAVGPPTIAVLASLTISLIQISAIREDIREMRGDIKTINSMACDLMRAIDKR